MKVEENLVSNLTVLDSDEVAGKLIVADNETGEFGDVVAETYAGKLLVQWRDAIENDNHEEFELVLLSARNVKRISAGKMERKIKTNPFGLFGKKKEFSAGFWTEDGQYHNATLKGRNVADAKRFAKRGWGKNIEFDIVEEMEEA